MLLMAFNNHMKMTTAGHCPMCRTFMDLAVSYDGGVRWYFAAYLDEEVTPTVRIHYPTIQLFGSKAVVLYSKFYLDSDLGQTHIDQGIRMAVVDLSPLLTSDFEPHGQALNAVALDRAYEHFLHHTPTVTLKPYCCGAGKFEALVKAFTRDYNMIGSGSNRGLLDRRDLKSYAMQKLKAAIQQAAVLKAGTNGA